MTKDKPRTLRIYHSCEAPDAPVLLRFKAGTHTLYHPFLDPHASAPLVWIPKRKGAAQQVRRCLRPDCETCAATEDVGDLTLEVAKVHGIRGVALKPSGRARTVGERVADGGVRGAWMYGGGVLGVLKGDAGVMRKVDWERFGGGHGSGQVGRWLEGLPWESEAWESGEVSEETVVGSGEDRLVVEGEGRLDDGLSVGERLTDFFARRDELKKRYAEAARSQTQAVNAEWRKSSESAAAAPWHLPTAPVPDAPRWDVNIANSQLAYRLQSQVTAPPRGPFEVDICEYTKPITHHNRSNLATNPPLTGPPLHTEAPNPLKHFLTEPHQTKIPLPFISSGTTEAKIQYYIKDLEAHMSAQGFASTRRLSPPPVKTPVPSPGMDPTTRPAACHAAHQAAAAPPPVAHRLAAGPCNGLTSSQRTPGPAHPALPATSSLGTKRALEDAGLVAQERRQKIRRLELQSGA
ncbi:hypothetical protein LTR01_008768 [Friedmanniomyces endolithicus]|nr:hypothetical protein LTR01_008768 [Friedmanniomyces endolithicus]KAK0823132.1 hypothetical protein LTR73_008753 [Friedmanniomyces endolithicus]